MRLSILLSPTYVREEAVRREGPVDVALDDLKQTRRVRTHDEARTWRSSNAARTSADSTSSCGSRTLRGRSGVSGRRRRAASVRRFDEREREL